ncbi:MAG: transposase, partial [Chlamydiae bacterium]|nr:transposase [Chlamydiota bacterium]
MKRLQAFKFELQPNGEQVHDLLRFCGSCRFVFNKALNIQIENYDAGNKFIGYVEMAKLLTEWRNSIETPWLKESPCHPLQQALKDLDKAFQNFFARRASFPCFKRKGSGDSFRFPDHLQIKLDQANNRIFLPKLGWIRYRNSRKVLGEVRNVTIASKGKKWFISIQTQREVEQPVTKATTAIAVDVGIIRFAAMNDGSYIEPLNSFKKHQKSLVKYQRQMSRKVKYSNNWKKAKAKVQQVYINMANARNDFLHKITTTISKNHALVCIEDLQICNMSKSAEGTKEQPGKKKKKKSGLNRCIQ